MMDELIDLLKTLSNEGLAKVEALIDRLAAEDSAPTTGRVLRLGEETPTLPRCGMDAQVSRPKYCGFLNRR